MYLEYFIPFYKDKYRLFHQLLLLEKHSNVDYRCIIYDSSPIPIEEDCIKRQFPSLKFTYRKLLNDSKVNTFYPKLQEFALSDDYTHGAVILPQDELIIFNAENFAKLDCNYMAAARSFWISPTENKIAEHTYCCTEGVFKRDSDDDYQYQPQYHGTYISKEKLRLFGKFIKEFLIKYGIENRSFCDIFLKKVMEYSNVFYCKSSFYFLEKLSKRKNAGTFIHPSRFIQSILKDEKKKMIFFNFVIKSLKDHKIEKNKIPIAFKSMLSKMDRSLIIPNFNSSHHLFYIEKDNINESFPVSIGFRDEFSFYHRISKDATKKQLDYIFSPESAIGKGDNIDIIRSILESYEKQQA